MVGIPRSTGCATCRRRKVKCDEAKPICHRCTKAGLECGGYQKETVWRHTSSTAPFLATNGTALKESSKASASDATALSLRPRPGAPTSTRGGRQVLPDNSVSRPRATAAAPASIPNELSLVAFEGDFCFSFMFSNFVWKGYGNQWLAGAAEGKLGSLALASSRALAQSTFGRAKGVMDVERKGAIEYGYCLEMLAKQLSRLQGLGREDASRLVVPVLVLLMHTSTLTDQTAAGFHVSGMVELIRIAGPQAFKHQPLLNAMEAARATIVVASLITRRRTFFEESAWINEPWALHKAQKPPQSHLLDVLACIPGILEDCDTMSQMAVASDIDAMRISIKSRLESLLRDLYCWRWRWQARNHHQVQGSFSSSQPSSAPRPAIGPGHGHARHQQRLTFRTARAAADMMQYNTVLIWLLALLRDVEPVFINSAVECCARAAMATVLAEQEDASSSFALEDRVVADAPPWRPLSPLMSFEPLRRPGSSVSVRDAAIEICRVYQWQTSCHGGPAGEANLLYMWPVGIAMSVLDGDAEGRRWIAELLETDPLTRGYGGFSETSATAPAAETEGEGVLFGDSSENFDTAAGESFSRMSDSDRVKNFGFYLLRELGGSMPSYLTPNLIMGSTTKIENPGLIHLLLLRGGARKK